MKGLMIAIIAAAGFGANASVERISHDYKNVLGGIDIQNACLTDTQVQSIEDVLVCTRYEEVEYADEGGSRTQFECVETAKTKLSYPRAYEVNECVNREGRGGIGETDYPGKCLEWSKTQKFLPDTIMVNVYEDYNEADTWPGEKVAFTFPRCQ